jgi:hypothetical protein
VELGRLPERTSPDMRRLADDMVLLMGLRLAAGEDRPLPYSTRFAAERMGWRSNHRRANRAILRLCEAGVIFCTGSLPPRGQPYGTKTYAPPLGVGASVVEGEAVVIEASASATRPSEPEPEVGDQSGVERAVLAARLDDGLTTWDGAEGKPCARRYRSDRRPQCGRGAARRLPWQRTDRAAAAVPGPHALRVPGAIRERSLDVCP